SSVRRLTRRRAERLAGWAAAFTFPKPPATERPAKTSPRYPNTTIPENQLALEPFTPASRGRRPAQQVADVRGIPAGRAHMLLPGPGDLRHRRYYVRVDQPFERFLVEDAKRVGHGHPRPVRPV